jgi:short-subunit dehydrogenase
MVRLNAISHISLTHHFGKRLSNRGKGGILLTGAMGAYDGVPYMASMAGSKALLLSLGKSLHYEFDERNLHITVLITSPTVTPILSKLGFDEKTAPMKPISVKQCVEEALLALSKNRPFIMPGRKYRIMNALVPGSVLRNATGKMMKKNNGIT